MKPLRKWRRCYGDDKFHRQAEIQERAERTRKIDRQTLRAFKPQSFQAFISLERTVQDQVEYDRLLDQLRREELI